MLDDLLLIVSGYKFECYFPHSDISHKRQQAAIHNYGVDPRDAILAIIDSTIMGFTEGGSADNGMALTLKGIYWKNFWAVKTRRNHYTWEEMVTIHDRLEVHSGNVLFEPGVEFYPPTKFKPAQIINLLQNVTRHYIELKNKTAGKNDNSAEVKAPELGVAAAALSDSSAQSVTDQYELATINVLAIMACPTGTPEDSALELAIEFISGDDDITNKNQALSRFSDVIEALAKEFSKAPAFLKIKQSRLLSEYRLANDGQKERILIMAEAVQETAVPTSKELSAKLIANVRQSFSR